MRTRVCTVINNNIAHEWTLARIASELLMSPSLLKKKLREEETSYSQLLTECRMQRALQLIVIHGFQLSELQYPVDITAYRISFTSFEIIMG